MLSVKANLWFGRRQILLREQSPARANNRLLAGSLWLLRQALNLPVANDKSELLNLRHATHENYTRYGYRYISRSDQSPGGPDELQ
jgi:hypothetical protein